MLFLTSEGRVHLGWRLSGFFGLTLLVALAWEGLTQPSLMGGAFGLLAGALAAGTILLWVDGRKPGALGFYLSHETATESVRGMGLGVLIGMIVVAGMALAGGVTWEARSGSMLSWASGALGAVLWFTIPAAAEEAFLRGYPLQALTEAYGPLTGIAATSVAFGVLHLGNPGHGVLQIVNVTVAGVLFGVVYVKTLSLWLVTGMHVGWNWAHGYLADVLVSGLDVADAPLYEGVTGGPQWLGGGAFGPEGSVVATGVLVAATVTFWRVEWLRPGRSASDAGSLAEMAIQGINRKGVPA